MSSEPARPVQVQAYAGSSYPERPLRILWQGAWRDVRQVESEHREPGRHCFTVRLDDDTRLRLCYDYENDAWQVLGEG